MEVVKLRQRRFGCIGQAIAGGQLRDPCHQQPVMIRAAAKMRVDDAVPGQFAPVRVHHELKRLRSSLVGAYMQDKPRHLSLLHRAAPKAAGQH